MQERSFAQPDLHHPADVWTYEERMAEMCTEQEPCELCRRSTSARPPL